MKRVLVSAFLPFNHKGNNYSAEVLSHLCSERVEIEKIIIDVVYDKCFESVSVKGLDNYDFIVALGEARMRETLTVERRAKNISSCSLPDNSGDIKNEQIIDPNCGEYIESTMDFDRFTELADVSFDAGKFVCNNLYFHLLKYDRSRTLFIHIPECNNDTERYKEMADKVRKIIEML